MATEFDAVYGAFLSKVSDYDLADMVETDAKAIMSDYMKQAIGKFSESCKKDLMAVTGNSFDADLTYFELDIISELMVEVWCKPRLYNLDLLRNKLSTKDFTTFSPANLLDKIREVYEQAHKRARSMINEYSFRENDIGEMK